MTFGLSEEQIKDILGALSEMNAHAKKVSEGKNILNSDLYQYVEDGAKTFFKKREKFIANIVMEGLFDENDAEDILFEQILRDNKAREISDKNMRKINKGIPFHVKNEVYFLTEDIKSNSRASTSVLGPTLSLIAASQEYHPEYLQTIKEIADQDLYLEDILKAYNTQSHLKA